MNDTRPDAAAWLTGLQQPLHALFTQLGGAARRRQRGPVQRRLLLGLELVAKIEEQLVLPALADAGKSGPAGPTATPSIAEAQREIELMRDVALLVTQTARANREVSMAVLEGLAHLHFGHMNVLIARPAAASVDWPRLEHEARGWLERWRTEMRRHGAIEDEDADPVGTPIARSGSTFDDQETAP